MQTVNYKINHLTGKGWRDAEGTVTVDETIGLKAGRDEFATARGTIKNIIRKQTICHPATRATMTVNGVTTEIWLEHDKFCHKVLA